MSNLESDNIDYVNFSNQLEPGKRNILGCPRTRATKGLPLPSVFEEIEPGAGTSERLDLLLLGRLLAFFAHFRRAGRTALPGNKGASLQSDLAGRTIAPHARLDWEP